MNPQDPVVRALKAVAEEDRDLTAPPRVEQALLAAFRAERMRRTSRPLRWVLPAAAMAAAFAIGVFLRPAPLETISYRPPVPSAPELRTTVAGETEAPVALGKPWREVAGEFVPVALSHLPLEGGSIVRVRFSPEAVRPYGIAASEPIDADLLLGQEGSVRAFRLITFEQ